MLDTLACSALTDDPFRCPTKWELWRQLISLLPRGRAWQTHEDLHEQANGESSEVERYQVDVTGLGEEELVPQLTKLQQYWAAYAELLEFLHQRACALINEFFCESLVELWREWGIEWAWPSPCEPWPMLCDKVRAIGSQRCEYLQALVAAQGYVVDCIDCGPGAVADCAVANCTPICDCEQNLIRVRIYLPTPPGRLPTGTLPPTIVLPPPIPFEAGAAVANCTPPCAPDPPPPATPEEPPQPPPLVVCLIEKYKPAHVLAIYEVIWI